MVWLDVAGLGLGVYSAVQAGQSNNSLALITGVGAAGLLLSNGPVFHAAHDGSAGKLALSFTVREGGIVLGGMAALLVYGVIGLPLCLDAPYPANDMPGICTVQPMVPVIIGAVVGGAAAVIFDDLVLAHDNTLRAGPSLSMAPLVVPKGSAAMPSGATGLSLLAKF